MASLSKLKGMLTSELTEKYVLTIT